MKCINLYEQQFWIKQTAGGAGAGFSAMAKVVAGAAAAAFATAVASVSGLKQKETDNNSVQKWWWSCILSRFYSGMGFHCILFLPHVNITILTLKQVYHLLITNHHHSYIHVNIFPMQLKTFKQKAIRT